MALENTPEKILALVLAGGQGAGLHPLTLDYAKPSVMFGDFRLVDFALSNLVNSGIESIYLLAQYKPDSLIEHVHANWTFAPNDEGRFVSIVVPKSGEGECRGSADAIYQNIGLIEQHAPELVAVFEADQIYRMDVRQMVDFHRMRNADVSIAATYMPFDLADGCGVVMAEENGKIGELLAGGCGIAANQPTPERVYVSTGNCLFKPEVLIDVLERGVPSNGSDLGRHLLPHVVSSHRVYAYDLACNQVPGIQPHEERAYWRDIGTLEAYIDALEDIDGSMPRFNLHNPEWPLLPALAVQRPLFNANHAPVTAARCGRRQRGASTVVLVD